MNYKEVIESRYNRQNWQLLLHDIFGSKIKFWNTPSDVTTSSPFAKQALWLGTITLSDEQTIAVYEVELSESVDIERNRRGIRDMLLTAWRNNGNAGAFMFCYRKNESVLRFSYVSEAWKFADDGSYQKESTDTRRFTYLLGEGHRSRTAIQQFEKLRDSQLSLKDLTKAFSVEAVSDMFFDGYKKQYENIIFYITGKRMVKVANKWEERLEGQPCQYIMRQFSHFPNPEKSIRDYVKKLMGRLVFLQFLQKKGWLGVGVHDEWGNGDPEFIQNLFARCNDKDHFIDNVLEPLFHDLNTEKGKKLPQYRTPYLNGGLFEREAADETDFPLPAQYMQSLLDFFASYNFTIDENDPDDAEVGVDPEMLGRIFENLLEDNKDKGAFYTPKEIVSYMCRESLIAYLQTGIEDEPTKEAIRQFVTTHQVQEHLPKNTDQLLKDVKICDPAIGSGAFPMGLLKELFLCRTALEGISQHQAAEIKKHIIQQNVYGVDIERGAVDIARLRFWLSLIVDEETPQALPNLDFKIMQGNSLLEQYKGVDLSRVTKSQEATNDFSQQSVDGDLFANAELPEILREMLSQYYDCPDHKEKLGLRARIVSNVKQQLYEKRINVDLGELDLSGNNQFFLWHTWFHDVFSKGGFDIVIGNPPYVLLQNSTISEKIQSFYMSFYKCAQYKVDLYHLFMELSCSISSKIGIITLITPITFLMNEHNDKLRKLLHLQTSIHWIVRFHIPLFENASVDNAIFIGQKGEVSNHLIRVVDVNSSSEELLSPSYFECRQDIIQPPKYFFEFENSGDYDIAIRKKMDMHPVLGSFASTYFGIQTYDRKVYVSNDKETNTFVPVVDGVNVKHYHLLPNTEYVDFRPETIKSGGNPLIYRKERILVRQIGEYPDGCLCPSNIYTMNTIYNIYLTSSRVGIKYLLALINSKVIHYYWKMRFSDSKKTFPKIKKRPLESIPIAIADVETQKKMECYVDEILMAKQTNCSADTSETESKIDYLVYQLYGLTYDEVLIVDPETDITRAEYEK